MGIKLISDNLIDSLLAQWAHEKYNAHLYLYISSFLKNKGLNHLGSRFYNQYKEENEHSEMIINLLTDINADVVLPEIDEVNIPITSIMDVANKYLLREYETTMSLDEIKKISIDESNPVVEEFMRNMIEIQRHEYEEATDFMDKAELTGNNWFNVFLWDLGEK